MQRISDPKGGTEKTGQAYDHEQTVAMKHDIRRMQTLLTRVGLLLDYERLAAEDFNLVAALEQACDLVDPCLRMTGSVLLVGDEPAVVSGCPRAAVVALFEAVVSLHRWEKQGAITTSLRVDPNSDDDAVTVTFETEHTEPATDTRGHADLSDFVQRLVEKLNVGIMESSPDSPSTRTKLYFWNER
jgi:hypothetical protein